MIVVTGATGNIGSELIRLLAERGAEVKALSRKPDPGNGPPNIEWVQADLADRRRLSQVFAGAERLFLLTGNVENMVQLQKNAIAAAEETGVDHIVKLSALGASEHSKSVIGVWHYNIEQALRASDVRWTILRPHVFMQNLLEQRTSVQAEREVVSPSGEAAIPMIDTRDIAAAAAVTLTEEGHRGKRYTLTGSQALSYRQATEHLSRVLEVPLKYVPETEDQAWSRLHDAGLPAWLIGAQLALAEYHRQGMGTDIITDAVREITDRPPRTFEEFARDYASFFQTD